MKIVGICIIAFFLYYLQQVVYRKWWNHGLHVSLQFAQTELFAGEESQLLEVIENRKRLPLPMLKVKFQTSRNLEFADIKGSKVTDFFYRNDVFEIGGGEKITRTLKFVGKKRGYYKINGIDLVGADLFFSKEMVESRTANQYVYVYPKPFSGREFLLALRRLNGEVVTKRHLIEDPFEYRGIREYQPYDDMRMVNWKATARMEELMVNERNYTALKAVRIFLNVEDKGILKKEDEVEASICMAAGLTEHFFQQGMTVECWCNGTDIITGECMEIPGSAGMTQMKRINKALARLDIQKEMPSFVNLFGEKVLTEGKGTMTIFVSANGYEDFVELLEEYKGQGSDFVWFYPVEETEEPELPKSLENEIRIIHTERMVTE